MLVVNMRAVLRVVTCALLTLMVAPSAAEWRCHHEDCQVLNNGEYLVDGHRIRVAYSKFDKNDLQISCDKATVLQSDALPHADPALVVPRVTLLECPVPADRSLSDTLAAINVTLECGEPALYEECLKILYIPSSPPLTANHFVGFESLKSLAIDGNRKIYLSLERNFLAPLQNLSLLRLSALVIPTGGLHSLPPSLRELDLRHIIGLEPLPHEPSLGTDPGELQPALLGRCDSLRVLRLHISAVLVQPDGWLANCSHLELLAIDVADNQTLRPKQLLGAFTNFTLWGKPLQPLPAGLLNYAPRLHTLELFSGLRTLASDTFVVARRVRTLTLSGNQLDSEALHALAPLQELEELDLHSNPRLGDVCEKSGYSPLRNMKKLKSLDLSYTRVASICIDWQHEMTKLRTLDLQGTNVSSLQLADLQFTRNVTAVVYLPKESLAAAEMTRENYNDATRRVSKGVFVFLRQVLECNCSTYWMRRALDLPQFQRLNGLRCDNHKELRDVLPEDLWCARPDECLAGELPAACACIARPDDDSSRTQRLVRVRCERGALTHVPLPRALHDTTERRYELLLAGNNISEIRAHHLPNYIKGLDLRNNFLKTVDEKTATRLGTVDGMLRLAGNPLDCSCRNAPLLRALRTRNASRIDLTDITCSNGSKLYAAFAMSCLEDAAPDRSSIQSLTTWLALAGGLAMVLAVALFFSIVFSSPERRFFARAVLHRWGFEWRADEPEDSDRRYDAFVTFSHKDEAVVYELMARLEPTHRLCIHVRDWVPGGYITDQIVESVRESRRTLALVSRHFLASSWTGAEFREAHAAAMLEARPRLIVILLEEPAALDMDDQLRHYVATQTYLRWGEYWFWHKLAVALPRPRMPPPSPSPLRPDQPALELTPSPAPLVHTIPGTHVLPSVVSTPL